MTEMMQEMTALDQGATTACVDHAFDAYAELMDAELAVICGGMILDEERYPLIQILI